MKFKWLRMPRSNETRMVQAVRMWEVRWESRHGEYKDDTRPQVEVFASEELAKEFATALRNAFALIRHTSGHKVQIKEAAGQSSLFMSALEPEDQSWTSHKTQ